MAARSRPPRQIDIHETLRLYVDASRRIEQLVHEGEELRRAGKIREARKKLAAAEEIQGHLKAIEDRMKPKRPGD